MMDLTDFGKMLLLFGGMIVLLGLILVLMGRVPFLGRLPGDIVYRRGNFSCYAPIVTCLLLSLLLTIVLNLIIRLLGR
ncbi:MAG: DUF2905 domain-containing protein [Anaerolineae bacterium]